MYDVNNLGENVLPIMMIDPNSQKCFWRSGRWSTSLSPDVTWSSLQGTYQHILIHMYRHTKMLLQIHLFPLKLKIFGLSKDLVFSNKNVFIHVQC